MRATGAGVGALEGQMVDAPVIARAARILAQPTNPDPDPNTGG